MVATPSHLLGFDGEVPPIEYTITDGDLPTVPTQPALTAQDPVSEPDYETTENNTPVIIPVIDNDTDPQAMTP